MRNTPWKLKYGRCYSITRPCSVRGKLYPHYWQSLSETSKDITLHHLPSCNVSDSCEAGHTTRGYSTSSPERSLADVLAGKKIVDAWLRPLVAFVVRVVSKFMAMTVLLMRDPQAPESAGLRVQTCLLWYKLVRKKLVECTPESESFKSHQLLSYSIISHLMEPEDSLPFLKSPPLFPILRQTNPVHTTSFYFSEIRFNIILPHNWDLPSGLLTERALNCAGLPARANCKSPLVFDHAKTHQCDGSQNTANQTVKKRTHPYSVPPGGGWDGTLFSAPITVLHFRSISDCSKQLL
jgi:hypothetical protein